MHCTLLIPNLLWPRAQAEAMFAGLSLPALQRLVARARRERFPSITSEGWLCQAFEIARQQDWPIAPLTLELDAGESGDAYWLRADPVHVRVERDHLTLVENALFDVTQDEAHALVSALGRHFADDGIAIHALHPKRWYARLARTPKLVTRSVTEAAGQNVQHFLPSGEDALAWHRVFNEAQMLLHGHTVNAAREERGDPVVNSVWLWGGGTRPAVPGRPFTALWSDDPAAIAIAAAADTPAAGVPADAEAWLTGASQWRSADAHLIVLDDLASAAAYRDGEAWRSRLSALEAHWFAPLARALREGRIARLALVAPGPEACWRFDLGRADLGKFWRRAQPWSQYA